MKDYGPSVEYPRYELGTRVLLQNLTGDEEGLNGLAGEIVELTQLDLGPPACAGVDCGHDDDEHERMPESVRGWLHKVRLNDAEHTAQAGGFMDSRVFYTFQLLVLPEKA